MKKTAIIVLLLVATLTAAAQGDGSQYSVRYVKEHLLYQQGDEVNVIDMDMEWPEVVDGADMRPLQTFIVKHLLGGNGFDFDTSYASFRSAFGQPVTKQFQSTPDDKKTCYVDIKLKMVAHKAGRFVSYALEGYTEPAAQSSHKESQVSMLVSRVKGTIHWVSQEHCLSAEVRLYDRLWSVENPCDELANLMQSQQCDALTAMKQMLNPASLEVLKQCMVEPWIATIQDKHYLQFQRIGYFTFDKTSTAENMVFNRTVGLRDSWKK